MYYLYSIKINKQLNIGENKMGTNKEIRKCTACGKPMMEGFYVEYGEYYCSEKCLHSVYTPLQYKALYLGLNVDFETVSAEELAEIIVLAEEDEDRIIDNSYAYYTEWETITTDSN
jgi:recombinational DNA repair protein (RecF pathway)